MKKDDLFANRPKAPEPIIKPGPLLPRNMFLRAFVVVGGIMVYAAVITIIVMKLLER